MGGRDPLGGGPLICCLPCGGGGRDPLLGGREPLGGGPLICCLPCGGGGRDPLLGGREPLGAGNPIAKTTFSAMTSVNFIETILKLI